MRETKALYDNLFPSRIIVGSFNNDGREFGAILQECAEKKDVPLLQMESKEAEAVKLFSNAYLALRISYFNEFDTPDCFINCSYPTTKDWSKSDFKSVSNKSILLNLNVHLASYIWLARIVAEQMRKKKSAR